MAKKGENRKLKRLNVPRSLPISDKKRFKWVSKPMPGPHAVKNSISLLVFLRDVLGYAKNSTEARKILSAGDVLVNKKKRKKLKFPIGLMDIVEIPKTNDKFLITISKGRLTYEKTQKTDKKLCKVISKTTIKNNKISLGLHDGRTLLADNNVKVGDTIILDLSDKKPKMAGLVKLEEGATCLIYSGKHAGTKAKLLRLIKRQNKMEAELETEKGEKIITVSKYLFVLPSASGGDKQ